VKRRLVRVRPGGSARAGAARDARHLKEAEKVGDASHQQARDAMKGRWRHPKKSLGWYRDMKAAFAPARRGLTRPSTDSTNHENESHMTTTTTSGGFSAQESAAIENRAKELKAQAGDSDGQAGVLSKIHAMPDEVRLSRPASASSSTSSHPTSRLAPGTACRRTRHRAGVAR